MGPKHGLKFNEGRRCKYVESERDQSNRWFFSRSGWRCCFTGDQHSGCHDREREFSQFPSGHGGAENGNRDILGAHRRGTRWKQESHRTEEQATGSGYQDVKVARTLRAGDLRWRHGYLPDQRLRGRRTKDGHNAIDREDPQDRTRLE